MSNFGYDNPEAGPSWNTRDNFEYDEHDEYDEYYDDEDFDIDYGELKAQEDEAIGEIDYESTEYEISDDDMTEDEDDKIRDEIINQAEAEMKRLCERCRLMTSTIDGLTALASKEGYKHSKVQAVHISAESGCPFCVILRNNYKNRSDLQAEVRIFSRNPLPASDESAEKYTAQSQFTGHPFETIPLAELASALCDNAIDNENNNGGGFLELSKLSKLRDISSYLPFTNADSHAAKFTNVKGIYIPVTGKEIRKEILRLLTQCSYIHKRCPGAPSRILPHRVLDVKTGDKNVVKLITNEGGEEAQYLALSYRWGGPQELTTTKATLEHHTRGISVPSLPATIRDAVKVTRNIGFRYLWVDSLCIIQDDTADKMVEIGRMGDIYKNATLTIAAANTASAQDSFLAPRPIPQTCTVPYLLPDGSLGMLWVKDGAEKLLQSPLDSRAWTFQESLLSPRMLWYGPGDLVWKCATNPWMILHHPRPHDIKYQDSISIRLPADIHGHPDPDALDPEHAKAVGIDLMKPKAFTWCSLVRDYSGRELTFAEDRLPALAGVASELQKVWKDEFVAGLWKGWLVRHLGWSKQTDTLFPHTGDNLTMSHQLQESHKSPTWAWISYQSQVEITEVVEEHAEVLDFQITLENAAIPYSQILHGTLVIEAACISEKERRRNLSDECSFKWDFPQDTINLSFRYALLGRTEKKQYLALVLAPGLNSSGNFTRIGIMYEFSIEKWTPAMLKRRKITII